MYKFISLALLIFLSTSLLFADDQGTKVKNGQKVPEFKFELNKSDKGAISDYRGKIVLINFFATWCPPCRKELPEIEKDIWSQYKGNPRFAMLTFGREHNWEELNIFKEQNNISFPVYPDPDRSIYGFFAEKMIPRNFVIDENGNIIYMSVGFNPDEFEALKKLLEKELK